MLFTLEIENLIVYYSWLLLTEEQDTFKRILQRNIQKIRSNSHTHNKEYLEARKAG